MIIKAKNPIYKRKDLSQGVLLNLQIRDINTYYDRFNNTLNFLFGVFQRIDNEFILVEEIKLTISEQDKRTGYVQLPDPEGTGEGMIAIEEYYMEHGTLEGVTVIDYGIPSIELAKTFFEGGTLDNPEIQAKNSLAKDWILNTITFEGDLVVENFEF